MPQVPLSLRLPCFPVRSALQCFPCSCGSSFVLSFLLSSPHSRLFLINPILRLLWILHPHCLPPLARFPSFLSCCGPPRPDLLALSFAVLCFVLVSYPSPLGSLPQFPVSPLAVLITCSNAPPPLQFPAQLQPPIGSGSSMLLRSAVIFHGDL